MLACSRFITLLSILDELIFLNFLVLITNIINIDRYNQHKQKLYWVLKNV